MVITTRDIKNCLDFYEKLGFKVIRGEGRYELFSGDFKINVHILGKELFPHAKNVKTGSADICFEIDDDLEDFKRKIEAKGITIEMGIVSRTGVRGAMRSIYLRDRDENLLEFSSYK